MKITYKKLHTSEMRDGRAVTAWAVYATHSHRFVGIVYRRPRAADWRREYKADVKLARVGTNQQER